MVTAVEVTQYQYLLCDIHQVYIFCIDNKAAAETKKCHSFIFQLIIDRVLNLAKLVCHKSGSAVGSHHVGIVASDDTYIRQFTGTRTSSLPFDMMIRLVTVDSFAGRNLRINIERLSRIYCFMYEMA